MSAPNFAVPALPVKAKLLTKKELHQLDKKLQSLRKISQKPRAAQRDVKRLIQKWKNIMETILGMSRFIWRPQNRELVDKYYKEMMPLERLIIQKVMIDKPKENKADGNKPEEKVKKAEKRKNSAKTREQKAEREKVRAERKKQRSERKMREKLRKLKKGR